MGKRHAREGAGQGREAGGRPGWAAYARAGRAFLCTLLLLGVLIGCTSRPTKYYVRYSLIDPQGNVADVHIDDDVSASLEGDVSRPGYSSYPTEWVGRLLNNQGYTVRTEVFPVYGHAFVEELLRGYATKAESNRAERDRLRTELDARMAQQMAADPAVLQNMAGNGMPPDMMDMYDNLIGN